MLLVTAVGSKAKTEAATKPLQGEALVSGMEVLAVVLPNMEKDQLMMEEEKGRPFLLLVRQSHLLGF